MNTSNVASDPPLDEIILESISDGVFTIDLKWRITSFNRAAEEITGIARQQAIGRHCWEVFRSNMCEASCALKRTMNEGKSFVGSSTTIISAKREKKPISVSTSLLKDKSGNVLGGVEIFSDLSLVESLRRDLTNTFRLADMVSRSPRMKSLFNILEQVAMSESAVLVTGETGTGKELMARAIHHLSPRKDGPFIALNCGALPDTLLESELFGYQAGAFTDARANKPGLFAAANNGTLMLDEIGDTSPAFQVRLLRVLETGEYQPLGSTRSCNTDVRLIAATNKNLKDLVKQGSFRQDLFYRINIVSLELPPLRQRKEDIDLLAQSFIARFNRRKGRAIKDITPEARALLLSYDFPGNIRELENIIERAFILCPDGYIESSHLPVEVTDCRQIQPTSDLADHQSALQDAERHSIVNALAQNNYHRAATAAALGMHKSTLFRKMKNLDIPLPDQDGRSKP